VRGEVAGPGLWHRHRTPVVVGVVGVLLLLAVGVRSGRENWPVYAVVLLVGGAAVVAVDRRVRLSRATVWGLIAFGIGHAAGGMVPVGDDTLYGWFLIDGVVRYDNVQHGVGFGFVGRAVWESLEGRLAPPAGERASVAWWLIVLGACAAGAVNEVIEYLMVLTIPGTDVGGYDNTARDLIANLIGGGLVGAWTAWRIGRGREHPPPGDRRPVSRRPVRRGGRR
jgi:hypothetical protein